MAALGMGSGACITAVNVIRAQPIRLDNLPSSSSQQQRPAALRSRISAQAVQQFSSGSLAGLCTGVVVALFSRTLVFLGSFFALTVYVASRYGIDLPRMLGVRRLVKQPAWWHKLEQSPWFTGSFALTFALAAFVRL